MNPNEEFREWKSCIGILEKIPEKVHKNWIPYDLNLTCISAHSQFIALGTNIGLAYWYDRHKGELMKLICADRRTPITKIALLESVDFMLAIGNKVGIVAIFQIPKVNGKTLIATTSEGGTDCFHIESVHKNKITYLEWSINGQRLFAADASGLVSVTNLDYSLRKSTTLKICCLDSPVTQMSYYKGVLLISSLEQSYIYYSNSTDNNPRCHVVGGKSRQIHGTYGGLIYKTSDTKAVECLVLRPNFTLLSVKVSEEDGGCGEVMRKMPFKSRLKEPHKEIPILNPIVFSEIGMFSEDNLNIVEMGEAIIGYNNKVLHIFKIDDNQVNVQASCHSLKSILDLSVSNTKEIFVLENSRTIVRMSTFEDKYETDEILSKDRNVSSIPEGGPGLECVSNFLTNSGKKIFNRFPKLMSLGELGEVIFGEIDAGEEVYESSLLRNEAFNDSIQKGDGSLSDEDSLSNIRLELTKTSSHVTEPQNAFDVLVDHVDTIDDVLDLKDYLPETKHSKSLKESHHPDPLVRIPIDVPISIAKDEAIGDGDKRAKLPLSIEIRKDPVEGFSNWYRLSGTGQNINNFAVCSVYIIIQDDCDRSFISYRRSGFKFWMLLKNFGPWHHLSLSFDGQIVWRLLDTVAYSLITNNEELSNIHFFNWRKISEPRIIDIHLTENDGYILNKGNNTIVRHSNLNSSRPFDSRCYVMRPVENRVDQLLHISDEIIYAMDKSNMKLSVCPFYNDSSKVIDFFEDDVHTFEGRSITSVSLVKSLSSIRIAVIDNEGMVFLIDKTLNKSCWFSPHFMSNIDKRGVIRFLEDSLYVSSHCDIYLNEVFVSGDTWKYINFEAHSKSSYPKEIYCNSLDRHFSIVWARLCGNSPSRRLHYFNSNKEPLSFKSIGVPKNIEEISVISCYGGYTWMLTKHGAVYSRTGVSKQNLSGNSWVLLDCTQLVSMNTTLKYLSLGTEVVWAVDQVGKYYMRLGPLSHDKDEFSPAWITGDVELNDSLEAIKLVKIFASNANHIVWAIDDKERMYCRTGISHNFRFGNRWNKVDDSFGGAVQIAVSGSRVWALNSVGKIYLRVGITQSCPEGQKWESVPGTPSCSISASACGRLFALSLEGKIRRQDSAEFNINFESKILA